MLYGHDALRRFKQLTGPNEVQYVRPIVAKDSQGNIIVQGEYGIIISLNYNDSDYSNIDILWEDYGFPNYKEKGLFGRFTVLYNEMELDPYELVIEVSNGNTVHLSY
ncbi:hypothetical protein MTP04_24520 [Lysinibacillus sp. PLM2]|nr:hypothetical protein MTP04_24520 [Lysinibacillus sp. PLM2]